MKTNIGIDIMGGDFAPTNVLTGVFNIYDELPENYKLTLIGPKKFIQHLLKTKKISVDKFNILEASDIINMDDKPTIALKTKTQSSISIGYKALKENKINALVSAGNTGAMVAGATVYMGLLKGIHKPCIPSIIPKISGREGIMLDVGACVECKPHVLKQFALMGASYAKYILNIENPRIALLSVGSEDEKGSLITLETFNLLKNTPSINFIGNIEGYNLFDDKADVVVCDGFTGNIVLKTCETFYKLMKNKNINDDFFNRLDCENFGGTPILGVNANIIIGHGNSSPKAIENMIKLSVAIHETNFLDTYSQILN